MNEAQIRERLNSAIGEARYPVFLSGQVAARPKEPTTGAGRRPIARRNRSFLLVSARHTGSLLAALLVVLLIASLAVGMNLWRSGDLLNPRPAGQSDEVERYQAAIVADQKRFDDTEPWGGECLTLNDGCPPKLAANASAVEQWLEDLVNSKPPARFIGLDSVMRHHLALRLSYTAAVVAAVKAHDQAAFDESGNATDAERAILVNLANAVLVSSQARVAAYAADVNLDETYLRACALCQLLLSQSPVNCEATQRPNCVSEVAALRLQIETYVEDLARNGAPNSLATNDTRLQTDLVAAYEALDSIDFALSGGDRVGLQAAHDLLRQALGRVTSDAAEILRIS